MYKGTIRENSGKEKKGEEEGRLVRKFMARRKEDKGKGKGKISVLICERGE